MTEMQAYNVKHRMRSTNGWDDLADNFPNFKKAIESLPDYEPLRLCNSMLQDMLSDAIKDEVTK